MRVNDKSKFQYVTLVLMAAFLSFKTFATESFANEIQWRFGESGRELQLLKLSENTWEFQGQRRALYEIADFAPELRLLFPDLSNGQTLTINGREVTNNAQLFDEIIDNISTIPLPNAGFWFEKFNLERDRIMENTIALRPLEGVLKHNSVLFVTHASAIFDVNQVIAPVVNELSLKFRNNHNPIIYIMNRDELFDLTWFPHMRDPDYVIESSNGHFDAQLDAEEVVMTGGFFSLCFNRSLNVILQKNKRQKFTIKVPLKGVYEDKYFFPLNNPGPAYFKWFESTKAPVDLAEILKIVGTKSFKNAVETLFERSGNYHLTIKLRNEVLKIYPAKRSNARKIQLIFE